jgi:hypothetical protein
MSHRFQIADQSQNHLLASLSVEDYARLVPHLHAVRLGLGDVISQGAGDFGFGVVGTSFFLGGNPATNRAIVGIAGFALRMEARFLRDQFMRGGAFQHLLLRYTSSLISQISLTAACNRKHILEKRLCRWLLLLRDRVASDELIMTQEFIANMLGGRRETVTVAAGRLQDAGLIHYTRGRLRIVNRKGLEEAGCACYRAVRAECDLSLPPTNDEYLNVCAKTRARPA